MKKIRNIGLYLCLVLSLILISPLFVNAEISKTYENNSHTASYTPTSEVVQNLFGVTYTHSSGVTEDGGNQSLHVFMMKTDGVNSKLVTWAAPSSNDGYTRMALSSIAANYEANHPGWKVIAGINADQYFATYGTALGADGSDKYVPTPYYPLIIDGEARFPITATGNMSNYVGFRNDGSSDGIVENENPIGYILQILDSDNQVLKEYTVDHINESSSGTCCFAPIYDGGLGITKKMTLSNNSYYVVEKAEMSYLANSVDYADYKGDWATNVFFGRGSVSNILDSVSLTNGQFAITTDNNELKEALTVGTRIRVMMTYAGDMKNVEAASGFHTVHKFHGEEVTSDAPYNTQSYPRSIFGQTEDGTYFLMASDGHAYNSTNVVDGKEISGLNWKQVDAVLNEFGVYDAYQDDGGGSVTAVIRNDKGGFTCVNSPSEKAERYIYDGLFFVVRDVSFTSEIVDINQNRIDLKVLLDTNYNHLYARINNDTQEVIDGCVSFSGLTSNTTYVIYLSYEDNSGTHDVISTITFLTYKELPSDCIFSYVNDGTNITLSYSATDKDKAIQYIYVKINDQFVNLSTSKPSITLPISRLKDKCVWYVNGEFSISIGDGNVYKINCPKTTLAYLNSMMNNYDETVEDILK